MNRHDLGRLWLEHQIVFGGQFLEESLLSLRHFFFLLFESGFDIRPAMHHQPPEHLRQLARQRQDGHQTAPPPFQAPVESAQRLVPTAAHAARDHAEEPSSSVARTLLAAAPFAALPAAGRQPQPRRELLLGLPRPAQIGAHFAQQLPQDVIGYARQRGRVFLPAQSPQQAMQARNLRRVDRGSGYQIHAGMFRFVCKTDMLVADSLTGPVVTGGTYEHLGDDILASIKEATIGYEGMKIDRMFYEKFEDTVRENDFIAASVEAGQWDRVIDYVNREVFEKPEEFY